jgi:hypothetical protein
VVEASVYSLEGDSGSPTTYFALVDPLLDQWGLTILE